MSDNNDNWDDGNSSNDNVPKALRDHLKKVEADLKEMREKNAALEVTQRANAISTVLTSKGFNPKIAGLVPSTVEATEEKLMVWLDDNAELFPKSTPATPPPDSVIRDVVSTEEQAPTDRMGTAAALGLPADKVRALEADMDAAKTPEELDKVLGVHRGLRFS